jgi:hypothetical protein
MPSSTKIDPVDIFPFTREQVDSIFAQTGIVQVSDCERDNQGQLILYTGYYEWSDGNFRMTPEPVVPIHEELL